MDLSSESLLNTRARAARDHAEILIEENEARLAAMAERLAQQSSELTELRTKIANLEAALETNRRIAQAIGIIMASKKVTEEEALNTLRGLSQRSHQKLRSLAEVVVLTGEIPTDAA